jgi:uncharacterized protein YecE (DUF72 family)
VAPASNQDSDDEPALNSVPIANLHLGSSSWSSEDWVGVFYPEGTPPADFLTEYAKHFSTVEVDSTFYRSPSSSMVKNWAKRTPPGFVFAAKVPRSITHDKVMENCDGELKEFLGAMDLLGEKLGPLLFQFPYFNRQVFASGDHFLNRLEPFLKELPSGYSFAVEVRNKGWINERFLDVLRKRNVALALIDHPWMTPVDQLMKKVDPITADFTYIRWLGDRKRIEEKTQRWNQVIVNRQREMETWVPAIDQLLERRIRVYGYFNNHYAGFAPASIALFLEVWERRHGSR